MFNKEEYMKKYYATHRKERRERNKKLKQRLREFVDDYKKKTGCQYCKYNKYPHILVFHHKIPLKKQGRTCITNQHWSVKRLKEEIKKCVLLCPNCHAIEHYIKGQGFR